MNVVQRFNRIVDEFREEKGVTLPSMDRGTKRSFGSSGMRINGKVFAMLFSEKDFVVKLPRAKVDALVIAGDGQRFDPRRNGRVMREWIVMKPDSKSSWLQLAREARVFVGDSAH